MPPSAAVYRGSYLPFTRGYAFRSASTQAHEMDRNLMFFYEHQNLYDPDQARRISGSSDGSRRSREQYRRITAPVNAPPSPPRTPSPALVAEAVPQARDGEEKEEEEEEEDVVAQVEENNENAEMTTAVSEVSCSALSPSSSSTVEPASNTDAHNEIEEGSENMVDPSPEDTPEDVYEGAAEDGPTPRPSSPFTTHEESTEYDAPRLSTSTDDYPPSYRPPTIQPPTYQSHTSTTLVEASCPPELVDTLRRFLIFCLAIDYDLVSTCPETLNQADWLPFLRLARHWSWRDSRARYMQGYDPIRPAFLGNPGTTNAAEDDERALRIEQCIFTVVVKPALALGVPADIATTMLRQFPTSITSSGTHLPLHHRYRSPSTKSLATKLLIDREILFDTVTQHSHQIFRSALHEANERIVNKHFVKLRSPDDYELTQFGLMREKLEGRGMLDGLSRIDVGSWGAERCAPRGRRRLSRWMRKLSSN